MTASRSLALVLALAGIAALRARAADEHAAAQTYEDVYYVPPAEWLPVMSLGHQEALADLLWCSALVYQGDELVHGGGLAHVFEYTEAMLTLDPQFRAVYVWVSSAGIYSAEPATREDFRHTLDLLRRGRREFPRDGELAWLLGATLSFEVAPNAPAEEQEAIRLEGAENLMDAARMGAAPDWLVLSSTSMLANLGQAERATAHLEEMYSRVSDEGVRASIAARIEEIRSEAYGAAFVDANDELERQRLRTFPYVSPDFYFLIAPEAEESSWRDALGEP